MRTRLYFICTCFTLTATVRAESDQVVLFPTAAHQRPDGAWVIPLQGWVYEETLSESTFRFWTKVLDLDDELSRDEQKLLRKRLGAFLVDNESNVRVGLSMAGAQLVSPPTAPNGQFRFQVLLKPDGTVEELSDKRTVPAHAATASFVTGNREIAIHADKANGRVVHAAGRVHLVAPTGVSIVCDIDDTIRRTGVGDREKWFRSTFLEKFRTIDGMPSVLRHWQRDFDAEFHYVSVCPWQLYTDLEALFEKERVPRGSFHLKSFRIKEGSLRRLFDAPDEHKRAMIGDLLDRFPTRRFVMLGDGSERDPEIYADLARQYPRQVALIVIRDDNRNRDQARYDAAFRDLPAGSWRIFQKPDEVRTIVLPPLMPADEHP